MKRNLLPSTLLLAATLTTGCYHVTTHTGRPPSGQVITKKAHMFIIGLVGHESTAPCPPATIETQQGVVDWLLAGITLGLYTPYSLTVTCASDARPMATMPPGPQPAHSDTPSIRW